jgi:hypothetical protein
MLVGIGAAPAPAPAAAAGPAAHAQVATAPEGAALEAFAWLEGEWQRQTRRGLSIERWRLLPNGGLEGESVVIPAGSDDEIQVEALLLVRMGADIFYIARPRQNPYPTGFRLVSVSDDAAVFENPEHDFPQRITYRRTSAAGLTVTIDGPGDDGAPQEIDFTFERRPQQP